MKKLILFAVVMLLLASSAMAGNTAKLKVGTSTDLVIEILRYDPAPAQPGAMLDVWTRIYTRGSAASATLASIETLRDVTVEVVDEFPFHVLSDSDGSETFSSIAPGDVRVVKFRVKVDEDAVDGINQIKFRYSTAKGASEVSSPLDITVRVTEAIISVSNVVTEPEMLAPGQPATLTISLKNEASTVLKDIRAKVDFTGMPFAPLHSTTEKRIKNMKASEKEDLEFDLATMAEAESKIYKVPFTLTYYDEAGNYYTMNDTIGLRVYSQPDFELNIESSEAFQPGKTGSLVISLSNTGASNMKYTTIKLLDTEDYTVVGKAQEYLGNLESDDFETAEFTISVKAGVGTTLLQVVLDYKDDYNTAQQDEIEIELPIYSSSEIRRYGLNGTSNPYIMPIIYLFFALFLYFGIQTWRKTRAIDQAFKGGFVKTILLPVRIVLFFRWRNLKKIPRWIREHSSD